MSKQTPTKTKFNKTGFQKFASFTFVLAIIGTICAIFMAIIPQAIAIAGILLFIVLIFIILLCSACTAFTVWASSAFRNFITNFWSVIDKCFHGADQIITTIKQIFPYMALFVGILVLLGFIINLIAFLKHKEDNKQKRKFIVVSIMLGITVILITIGAVLLYLTK